jgi:hypothetical protein
MLTWILERAVKRLEEDTIKLPGGCWVYQHPWYGCLSVKGIRQSPHRWSYMYYRGPIPEGMHVLHECDMPGCWNPSHLFLGTNLDNVADARRKRYLLASVRSS